MEELQDIEDVLPGSSCVSNGNIKSNLSDPTDKCREKASGDSFIPGTQRIFVKTWGCTHNTSDSEYMAGLLKENGYIIVDNFDLADLCLLNSCTVKNPAEDHLKSAVNNAINTGKKVVVAGCVSQAEPNSVYMKGVSILGVQQIDRCVEIVEETLKGNCVRLLGSKRQGGRKLGGASLALPKIRRNPLVEIIPISTGCLNECTYCKTRHARGQLGSYLPEEIVARAKQAFEEGVRELWITSEDTGAYGRDIGTSLPELLAKVVEVIPQGCMLRLGMTNPPYILDHIDEIGELLNHGRMYAFLHIPVQSGSDAVLKEMRREYSRADFCKVVDGITRTVKDVYIATDLICGFPTETDEDFSDTLSLVREYKFPALFINQFYPRPGTVAAKMKRLPTELTKQRTREASALFNSYTRYSSGRIGKTYAALVTDYAHDKTNLVAHNKSYEQILIPFHESYMGRVVFATITDVSKHSMKAKVVGFARDVSDIYNERRQHDWLAGNLKSSCAILSSFVRWPVFSVSICIAIIGSFCLILLGSS